MLSKLASLKVFLILFVILIAYMTLVMSPAGLIGSRLQHNMPKDAVILDLRMGYSVDEAYSLLEKLGDKGRGEYLRNLLSIDIILPVLYSLVYASLLLTLRNRLDPKNALYRLTVYMPFLAGTCDLLENFSIVGMILNYPARVPIVAQIANFFTLAKASILNVVMLVLFAELIVLLFIGIDKQMKRRRSAGRR
jgi:hypothetical protein